MTLSTIMAPFRSGRSTVSLSASALSLPMLLQPLPGATGVDDLPPAADDLVERLQRAARDDRRREDHAGRHLVLQHQIGAGAHDAVLQHHAQGARQSAIERVAARRRRPTD